MKDEYIYERDKDECVVGRVLLGYCTDSNIEVTLNWLTSANNNSRFNMTTSTIMTDATEIPLGLTCDMHVHLRDGEMCELVTPMIRDGGVSIVYVMPNLQPPIITLEQVRQYRQKLQKLSPKTTFLMSLYLSSKLDPKMVEQAAKENLIHGIKCYPAGVTTNSSDSNVDPNDFSQFYPIFEVMERTGLVLNLHGEKPSCAENDINVLNAEKHFLPALLKLHDDFPNLKIILEHATTKDAIDTINKINENITDPSKIRVVGSITAHHLWLTIDDWAGNPINFCKPVAKLPVDKKALISAAISGKPWFIFGSDSAPHPIENKAKPCNVSAGIFTQRYALQYLAEIFAKYDSLDKLSDFVSKFPLQFYDVDSSLIQSSNDNCVLFKAKNKIEDKFVSKDGNITLVPFMSGYELNWDVKFV